jgi:hypothetical protein
MENLKDLLLFTLRMRASMECGEALRPAMTHYLAKQNNSFGSKCTEWLFLFDQTGKNSNIFVSHTAQILFAILADGLSGHSIYDRLVGFEEELLDQIENEIQRKMDTLPYILMVPLLLFMFPAYLILILGPVLNSFLKNM